MRAFIFVVVALTGLLAACSDTSSGAQRTAVSANSRPESSGIKSADSRIARSEDRGSVLEFESGMQPIRRGASVWYPVRLSEEHAIRAIAQGGMVIEGPDGGAIRVGYARHIEHDDGNWTWIGGESGDAAARTVITFGEKAVFGSITQRDHEPLQLTTVDGRTWLVEADGSNLQEPLEDADFIKTIGVPTEGVAGASAMASEAVSVQPSAVSPATVDLLVGYTAGFADRLGGDAQAATRLNYLVDLANVAYSDSQVAGRLRLVHSMRVDFADATSNQATLFSLTGVSCTASNSGNRRLPDQGFNCTAADRAAGLQQLVQAREQYGADLVTLVRTFQSPENGSCGVAWLLGAGRTMIDSESAAFGFSVISDSNGSQFPDEGLTCREEYLAHELGHNMGLQHDAESAQGSDDTNNDSVLLDPEEYGRFNYSFGYRASAEMGNFFTIMAPRRSGQTAYRVFSNPRINICGGFACGEAQQADNAATLIQTMPMVASFRASIDGSEFNLKSCDANRFDFNGDTVADVFWRHQVSGENMIWNSGLSGQTRAVTAVPSQLWQLVAVGDFNGDARTDVVWRHSTEGWNVLWPSANAQLAQEMTPVTSQVWKIMGVGDFNGDGRSDVFWRHMEGGWNHVWLGGNSSTPMDMSPVPSQLWRVAAVVDFNGDGRADVLWRHATDGWNTIWPGGASGAALDIGPMSREWNVAATGDFTGDLRADILWRNAADGRNVLWPAGQALQQVELTAVPSSLWEIVAVGDFTADGRNDLIWRHATEGWNVLWPSANSQLARDLNPLSAQAWQPAGTCRRDSFVLQ
jgi:peptidyl-Asp metalloendopeptidase